MTLEEISEVLKHTKNESAPELTGFPFSFYKVFWRALGKFIHKSALYSFEINSLPKSQAVGVISLLPKGNKAKDDLGNWRPITLQNSIYKLISGALSKRINKVLPTIINSNQRNSANTKL